MYSYTQWRIAVGSEIDWNVSIGIGDSINVIKVLY